MFELLAPIPPDDATATEHAGSMSNLRFVEFVIAAPVGLKCRRVAVHGWGVTTAATKIAACFGFIGPWRALLNYEPHARRATHALRPVRPRIAHAGRHCAYRNFLRKIVVVTHVHSFVVVNKNPRRLLLVRRGWKGTDPRHGWRRVPCGRLCDGRGSGLVIVLPSTSAGHAPLPCPSRRVPWPWRTMFRQSIRCVGACRP